MLYIKPSRDYTATYTFNNRTDDWMVRITGPEIDAMVGTSARDRDFHGDYSVVVSKKDGSTKKEKVSIFWFGENKFGEGLVALAHICA